MKQIPGEQWKRKVSTTPGFPAATIRAVDVVAGEHASFRVSSKEKIVFVFRPIVGQRDTSDIQTIQIYPFELKDGQRICVVRQDKGRESKGNPGVIVLDVVRYGDSSFALNPPGSHLEPGEYWIHVPGASGFNDRLITFGVD